MPSNVVKSFAEKTGKSVEEVEAVWEQTKKEAKDKFPEENESFWKYVTKTVEYKLGLAKPPKKKKKRSLREFLSPSSED